MGELVNNKTFELGNFRIFDFNGDDRFRLADKDTVSLQYQDGENSRALSLKDIQDPANASKVMQASKKLGITTTNWQRKLESIGSLASAENYFILFQLAQDRQNWNYSGVVEILLKEARESAARAGLHWDPKKS